MATKQQKYETMQDLLLLKLGSLLDIEEQLVKALPKLAKAAHDEKLREAFTEHLEETKGHVDRLNEAFEALGATAKKSKVEAIRGMADDADWIVKSVKNPAARDALLITAAQYVEHYEIAGYGGARAWAQQLGHDDVAELLQKTLDEEGGANKKLNDLAESSVNEKVETEAQE